MANKVRWFCTRALSAHLRKGLPCKRDKISSYLAHETRGGSCTPCLPHTRGRPIALDLTDGVPMCVVSSCTLYGPSAVQDTSPTSRP